MTAPQRRPIYGDAIGGRDDVPPEEAVPWFIGNFVGSARISGDWVLDNEPPLPIRLRAIGPAAIGFACAGVEGELRFSPEPSGWIVAVATIDGREAFRGYIERIYEEYEVWPPGAGAAPILEEPGRIGKHESWCSLSIRGWPELAPLANAGGWVNMRAAD